MMVSKQQLQQQQQMMMMMMQLDQLMMMKKRFKDQMINKEPINKQLPQKLEDKNLNCSSENIRR